MKKTPCNQGMGFKHAYSFKYCDKGQIIFNLTDFISCIK